MYLWPQSRVIMRLGIASLSYTHCQCCCTPLSRHPRHLSAPQHMHSARSQLALRRQFGQGDKQGGGNGGCVSLGWNTRYSHAHGTRFRIRYSAVELTSGSGVLQCPSEVDFYTRVPSNTSTWSTATCRALQCATAYTEVTGVAAGTPCVFPFREGGVLRHSCVSDDPWGTPAFCATAT